MTTFFFVLTRGGWSYGQQLALDDPLYLQATTATLCAIIVAQIANVFLCRSETRSAFRLGLLSNPLILGGILGEVLLILAIVYLPVGHRVFGTAPIPFAAWLVAAACAVGMFGLEEARKAVTR